VITLRVLKIALLLVMLVFPLFNHMVLAQTQPANPLVLIDSLETSDFPAHSLTFRFLSPSMAITSPLSIDQVSVLENGKELGLEQLTASYEGIHLAIAVNPNYDLGVSDSQGISRLNRVIAAINQLSASLQNSPNNRFSLFINPNLASTDLLGFTAMMESLNGYQENIRLMTSSLDSLDQAVAHLTTLEDDLEKALLFVTPALQNQAMDRFEKISEKISQAGIRFHVWLVANDGYSETAAGQKMAAAISKVGGVIFVNDGTVNYPDPVSIVQGLGYRYSALYTSNVRSSGTQQLVISVKLSSEVETSSISFPFELEVEPITPEFLDLPEVLTITKHENTSLTPDSLPIEVALSFPDHHPREIRSVELWVNNNRVQVNTQPPYGSFLIDLAQHLDLTQLDLEARVSDSFDLVGISELKRIPLTWDDSELIRAKQEQTWSIVLIALPIVALLIVLLLVRPWHKAKNHQHVEENLLVEPNQILPINQNYLATFTLMESKSTPSPVKPHEITQEITLIGKDPEQAQWLIKDEALEPLHAELRVFSNGQARVTDFNTTSGTWVNFEKVSAHGVELKQGDLVKFGSQLFRFHPRIK